jgi:sn-glycerol 3-phosphate transport system ATP-binding protein
MNLFPAAAFRKLSKCAIAQVGCPPGSHAPPAGGPLEATIRTVEYLGADILADCIVADTAFQVRLATADPVTPGQSIELGFEPDALHVFDAQSGARRDDLVSEIGAQLRS